VVYCRMYVKSIFIAEAKIQKQELKRIGYAMTLVQCSGSSAGCRCDEKQFQTGKIGLHLA